MKKSLLFILAFSFFCLNSDAQNNIQLHINHMLGDESFQMGTPAKNNIDHDFEASRLEYYISEITITHDGGTETKVEDFWILANAEDGITTQEDLGDYDINQVEKISFYIGVDPDHNHLDPATYPQNHPLAPQFPSMHWGWTSGYRFVAYEGKGGSNLDQVFQLHGLDDSNYFQTEIELDASVDNDVVNIYLNADYARALEDIEVNNGVIFHGANGDAKKCLENFRDFVFSAGAMVSSTTDFSEVNSFEVFPNPANGVATIHLASDLDLTYQIAVTDVLGNQIQFMDAVNGNSTTDLILNNAGFYFVNLIKDGQPIVTKKLISK